MYSIRSATRWQSDNVEATFTINYFEEGSSRMRGSEALFREALALDPTVPIALVGLGIADPERTADPRDERPVVGKGEGDAGAGPHALRAPPHRDAGGMAICIEEGSFHAAACGRLSRGLVGHQLGQQAVVLDRVPDQ